MISRTRLKKNEIKGAVFCIFLIVPQHRPAGDDAHVVGALQQRIGSIHRVGQRAGEGTGGCQRHVLPRASGQTHPHSGGAYSMHACLAGKCRICTLLSYSVFAFSGSPFFIRSKCLKVAVRDSISLARGLWRLRKNKMAF